MNRFGNCMSLHDRGGAIGSTGGPCQILTIALSRALVGELKIFGIANLDGSAAGEWTLPAGTAAGSYYPPGSGSSGGGQLFYEMTERADADAAVIAFTHSA